jgi:hypothetical protein
MVSSTAYYIKFDGFLPTFFNQFLVVSGALSLRKNIFNIKPTQPDGTLTLKRSILKVRPTWLGFLLLWTMHIL